LRNRKQRARAEEWKKDHNSKKGTGWLQTNNRPSAKFDIPAGAFAAGARKASAPVSSCPPASTCAFQAHKLRTLAKRCKQQICTNELIAAAEKKVVKRK